MKMKVDIAFVILHYITDQDTKLCVESIIKYAGTSNYKIIVVDNASSNNSFDVLNMCYKNNDKIDIIKNSENLGFSKGLNVGIKYANENWDVNFIAAINNDIELIQNNFYSLVSNKYESYKFSLLGPMIITKDGKSNVNPIKSGVRSVKNSQEAITRYKKIIKLCRYNLLYLYKLLSKIKKSKPIQSTHFLQDNIDFKLHGCFWVFSKKYFEVFDGLDESTFLYGEEDILYLHLMKNNLHTLYTPDILVYHKEDSSTNAMLSNSKQKEKFVAENCIKSLNIYIDVYNRYNEENL